MGPSVPFPGRITVVQSTREIPVRQAPSGVPGMLTRMTLLIIFTCTGTVSGSAALIPKNAPPARRPPRPPPTRSLPVGPRPVFAAAV
jgi:hypothetical protein